MQTQQRVALVTGAGQGIGRECAFQLAAQGLIVVATDIRPEAAAETVRLLEAEGGTGTAMEFDVADVPAVEAAVQQIIQTHGRIDVLVNNAGVLHTTAIEDIVEEEWDRILAVNLKGVFFLSQKVLPSMKEAGWGRIINIGSMAGRNGGFKNGLGYSAAKAGVAGLTMGMARRIAEYGITVNTVAPGTTMSPILEAFSAEQLQELEASVPLKRLGQPSDTAALVTFLASDAAAFITGTVIDVNGGMFIG